MVPLKRLASSPNTRKFGADKKEVPAMDSDNAHVKNFSVARDILIADRRNLAALLVKPY